MTTTNSERIKRYKARMKEHGFVRLSFWVHKDVVAKIQKERCGNECQGRALERLLLGESRRRPFTIYRK